MSGPGTALLRRYGTLCAAPPGTGGENCSGSPPELLMRRGVLTVETPWNGLSEPLPRALSWGSGEKAPGCGHLRPLFSWGRLIRVRLVSAASSFALLFLLPPRGVLR